MNTELSEFIRLSISEIMKGVVLANKDATKCGARVNPPLALRRAERNEVFTQSTLKTLSETGERLDRDNFASLMLLETADGRPADMIEFDVAVSISNAETGGHEVGAKAGAAGALLKVLSVDVGATGKETSEKKNSRELVNRIKFRIIVQYP